MLAAHGECVRRDLSGIGAEDSEDGIPEGGLTVCTAAVSDDHMLLVDLADCCHAHRSLHIVNEFLVTAEEGTQRLLPDFLSGITGGHIRDLGNEIFWVMGLFTIQTLCKVIGGIGGIEQIGVNVELGYIDGNHRLDRVLYIDDVPVIAVLHHELQIGICAQKGKVQTHDACIGTAVFEVLAPVFHIRLGDSGSYQVILCGLDSILRILQLKVHEIEGSPKSQLLVLLPALTVKSQKVGSTGVSQFIAKLPGEDFCFSQIGIILRFHALFFKVGIVLFRGNIPFLALDFLGKLHCAVPNCIQFAVIQGRVALLRSLQEYLVCLIAHTVFLQNPSGEAAHGVVTAAFQDGASHRHLLFGLLHLGLKQIGLIQSFINL